MRKTRAHWTATLMLPALMLALTACGEKPTTSTQLYAAPVVNCDVELDSSTLGPVPNAPAVHGPSYFQGHPERAGQLLDDYTRLFGYVGSALLPWTLVAAQAYVHDAALRATTRDCVHQLRASHVIN